METKILPKMDLFEFALVELVSVQRCIIIIACLRIFTWCMKYFTIFSQ